MSFAADAPASGERLTGIKTVIPMNGRNAIEAQKRIAQDIASGDKDAWTRMRHDLLDLAVPREEAIRIAKSYLNHREPIIRYAACETLYILGDRSGAKVLIDGVSNPVRIAVAGVAEDLRTWGAMTLAEYRESGAANAVAALYFLTKDPEIRGYAAELGARQIIPGLLAAMKERVWKNQLTELAQLGAVEAKPIIVEQFNKQRAPLEMRIAAAGAMLRLGEKEPYLGFLLDIADRYAAANPVGIDSALGAAGEFALRSLALVHSNEIREFLEKALDSKNVAIEELALIHLRVNYPESGKARERLLQSLAGRSKLGATTRYRLAAMSDDSDIRTVAAQRNELLWQNAALHEQGWDKDVWLRSVGAK